MTELNAAERLAAEKLSEYDTAKLRAKHQGAQAALARKPSTTNPYKGTGKQKLWEWWMQGHAETCRKHNIYIDGDE